MNKLHTLFLAILAFVIIPLRGQAPLYELSLQQKIQASPTILEGRVIGKKAFWNETHTLIHTAYTLEVYKLFKGQVRASQVDIIGEGGRIGLEMHVADPGLKMQIGEVGIFFCKEARVKDNSQLEREQFMPYGGVQGYVHYDELQARATDIFHVYHDIESQLYQNIATQTQQSYREYQVYSILDRQSQSQNRATPTFTNFTPASVTAGTDSVITITGNNFNAYDGGTNSLVYFANANDGGSTYIAAVDYHIVSWTNTEIQVRVPSGASTGLIGVQNSTSELGFTGSNLTVTYNLSNVSYLGNRFRPNLQDDNGTGGYDMVYSTNTANNGEDFSTSSAVAPFNRALSTWNCESLYNAETTGATTTSNTVDANAAPNIVMFDNDASPLASGTLGVCYSGYQSCDGTTWYINGYDIVFKRSGTDGITWNYGPTATTGGNYDFETVALHELGHSHGIGHINASGSVMHYALGTNYDARTLDATRDVAAGVEIINESKPMATCGGGVTGTTDFPCVLPVAASLEAENINERNVITWSLPLTHFWQSQRLEKFDLETQSYLPMDSPEIGACRYHCDFSVNDYWLKGDMSQYRLSLTDLNGRVHYSDALQVAHPNLTQDLRWTYERSAKQLICFLSFSESPEARFQLMDLQGREVALDFSRNGAGQWTANTQALSNGVYLLRLTDPVNRSQIVKKIALLD